MDGGNILKASTPVDFGEFEDSLRAGKSGTVETIHHSNIQIVVVVSGQRWTRWTPSTEMTKATAGPAS